MKVKKSTSEISKSIKNSARVGVKYKKMYKRKLTPNIRSIVKLFGGISNFSKETGYSKQRINQWIDRSTIPAERAKDLSVRFGKKYGFTEKDLRPDLWD